MKVKENGDYQSLVNANGAKPYYKTPGTFKFNKCLINNQGDTNSCKGSLTHGVF